MTTIKNNKRTPILNITSKVLASICTMAMTTAWGNNLTVNNLTDLVSPGDGQCALREAITNANTNSDASSGDCVVGADADTITFSVGGTVLLGSTLSVSDAAGLTLAARTA